MKAEINNENKAKFFAQYWGQDILCSDMYGDGGTIYSATMKDSSIKNEWLELKPISDIRDEDAVEIMDFVYPNSIEEDYEKVVSFKRIFIEEETVCQRYSLAEYGVSILRSRGYLVPWMGLSCEELIEAGWAKYKE